MPDLRCTVQTCAHNKNFYCDLDGIVVGGNKRNEFRFVIMVLRSF